MISRKSVLLAASTMLAACGAEMSSETSSVESKEVSPLFPAEVVAAKSSNSFPQNILQLSVKVPCGHKVVGALNTFHADEGGLVGIMMQETDKSCEEAATVRTFQIVEHSFHAPVRSRVILGAAHELEVETFAQSKGAEPISMLHPAAIVEAKSNHMFPSSFYDLTYDLSCGERVAGTLSFHHYLGVIVHAEALPCEAEPVKKTTRVGHFFGASYPKTIILGAASDLEIGFLDE